MIVPNFSIYSLDLRLVIPLLLSLLLPTIKNFNILIIKTLYCIPPVLAITNPNISIFFFITLLSNKTGRSVVK